MRAVRVFGVACVLSCAAVTVIGQAGATNGEWRSYGGDLGHTRYSPLDQINAASFNDLEVAWRFKTDNLGSRPEYKLEGTPVVVNGRLYATAGTRRSVICLDAATGEYLRAYEEGMQRYLARDFAAADPFVLSYGDILINPDTPNERRLPTRYADYPLRAGDTFRLDTPGGGGYGDPLARDPVRVLADVRDGTVSPQSAARDYGVVVIKSGASWSLDQAQTQARRARMRTI
jgi:quinoprotein glucose dehydrogenase